MGNSLGRRKFFLLRIAILSLWLIMTGLLIRRHYWAPKAEEIGFSSLKQASDIREEWMGIYFHGEKVGYAVSALKRNGDQLETYEHALMHLTILGTNQRIESRLRACIDNDFRLRSFDFHLLSGPARFRLEGILAGRTLRLTTHSGKSKVRSTVSLFSVPYVTTSIGPFLRRCTLEVGKEFSLPLFDPATLGNSEMKVRVVSKETIVHLGKPAEVYKLLEVFQGIETRAWVSLTGELLREEGPLGLSLVRESQEIALSGEWRKGNSQDLANATAIAVNKPIHDARSTSMLRIRLSNVALKDLELTGGRQARDGDILEVHKERPGSWKTFVLPYQGVAHRQYLQATRMVESSDPRIRDAAASIAKGANDAEEVVRKLVGWVYRNVEKRPVASVPSAVEVLELKAGDCNEHTALYSALSRALGIPTRICVGIVYLEGRFYYHSWPEVFLGDWLAVDPTFDQFPADATHVRLVIGELSDQVRILQVIGQMKVEILEYS
jgi:hypothetical protein